MAADWIGLIPLPPLAAAAVLAGGLAAGRIGGEASERFTARLALAAGSIVLALAVAAVWIKIQGGLPDQLLLGTWLGSGDYRINWSFRPDRAGLSLAVLAALLNLLTLKFSVNYLHREPGYHRFFMILSLFGGAVQLLALAGNAALAFAGWELAGVCSYLLIGYAYDRPNAAANATRAFLTNRIGDAGFLLGIFLAFGWTGALEWDRIGAAAPRLGAGQAAALAAAFLLAAMAKSAQVPFTPWLGRAIEGPTPSSAVFYGGVLVHAGAFLVLRLQPVFEASPAALATLTLVGLATAGYGWFCGLTQSDVKSALIHSTAAQVGLMFAEMGLGLWELALWHLLAHGGLRAYQFLSAPGLMHQLRGIPPAPPTAWLARHRLAYLASLQRLWLEPIGDWLTVAPAQRFSGDAQAFEATVVAPAFGRPAPAAAGKRAPHPGGFAGALVRTLADGLHWIEVKLVLRGVGVDLLRWGRRLGVRMNRLEQLLGQPRYLVLLVLVTLSLVV
jgi:NADH:ubiquinone oxidoreductase subunit 5 (subunit L)/multisubunit Na+/H+ antiporter MnhA subunit